MKRAAFDPSWIDPAVPSDDVSTSDLVYRLGKLIETRPGVIDRPDGHNTWDSNARPLEGLSLDVAVRRPLPPPRRLDAELAAAVNADWLATEARMDAAWGRFKLHRDKAKYRAECQSIISPDGEQRKGN